MNRLSHSTSPYLLQHRDNPVEWYPWGDEALTRAKIENKPILLSIGYSACHWCHVMAHESFEDPATAEAMNRSFINIKVDREERPDVDHVYQEAHHLLSGRSGGWPLTIFMTPEQVPFFSGTYFPRTARHGLPGFGTLLAQISEIWAQDPGRIHSLTQELLELMAAEHRAEPVPSDARRPRAADLAPKALDSILQRSDQLHGGLGGRGPKFPQPSYLELLRRSAESSPEARKILVTTLDALLNRGLFDHIGGGFFRYCVDEAWTIPHFEKMLYDNGALLEWLSLLYQQSPSPRIEEVVTLTIEWLEREMLSPEGLYYAALDADSEGEEGKFYLWQSEDLERHLGAQDYALIAPVLGFDGPPNFEHEAWHSHWHLRSETPKKISTLRQDLLDLRAQRIRPGLDNKVITSWNALTISGLTAAGLAFKRKDWLSQGKTCLKSLIKQVIVEGQLHSIYAGGRAQFKGHLDDHAFLLKATLEVLSLGFESELYSVALRLGDCLLDEFADPESGGFFFTSRYAEKLITRPKILHDGPTPSGYGVAITGLIQLYELSQDPRYVEAATKAIAAAAPSLGRHPGSVPTLMGALHRLDSPLRTLTLVGPLDQTLEWRWALGLQDNLSCQQIDPTQTSSRPASLSFSCKEDSISAYLCQGRECLPPVHDLNDLQALLAVQGRD